MGNKICFHPRVILTEDIALHFKSSNLLRDVLPIIDKWRADGAELCFGPAEFQATFDVVKDLERQFSVFDTDSNGRVDAHEVLMVYILLACGEVAEKVDAVFSTFDFAGCRGHIHSLNFEEAMIMLEACVKGVQKVCEVDFEIPDDEIFFHCKSLFDMHRVPHTGRITRKQFKDWCMKDPTPKAFVELFHDSQGLPDIYSQVNHLNLEQSQVFQLLARGTLHVSAHTLRDSEDWRRTLHGPSEDEMDSLVNLMQDHRGRIPTDRFHSVLRAWNIFNECDVDGSGTLDAKEMEILLWIYLRKKPDMDFVRYFLDHIDEDRNGLICRQEWVKAIVESHGTESH